MMSLSAWGEENCSASAEGVWRVSGHLGCHLTGEGKRFTAVCIFPPSGCQSKWVEALIPTVWTRVWFSMGPDRSIDRHAFGNALCWRGLCCVNCSLGGWEGGKDANVSVQPHNHTTRPVDARVGAALRLRVCSLGLFRRLRRSQSHGVSRALHRGELIVVGSSQGF